MFDAIKKLLGRSSESEPEESWLVMLDDRVLGRLVEPEFEDMFWIRYRLEPVDESPEAMATLYSQDHWNQCRFRFKGETTGGTADNAFAAGHSIRDMASRPRFVTMRGLSLS